MFFFKTRRTRKRRSSSRDPIEYTVGAAANRVVESRHKRSHSLRTRLILVLGVVAILQTGLLILGVYRYARAEKDRIRLVQIEKKHAGELEVLRPQVEQMEQEMETMVLARHPDLRRVDLDRMLSLDQGNIKNITISALEKGGGKTVEYTVNLMVRNYSAARLHPEATVVFFNRTGKEIAPLRFGINEDGTPTDELLERGETRSLTRSIELKASMEPRFFRIDPGK